MSTSVEIGATIDRADLSTVRITVDPALKPIRTSAADQVVGKFAAVTLVPGTLLTEAQLTDLACRARASSWSASACRRSGCPPSG